MTMVGFEAEKMGQGQEIGLELGPSTSHASKVKVSFTPSSQM